MSSSSSFWQGANVSLLLSSTTTKTTTSSATSAASTTATKPKKKTAAQQQQHKGDQKNDHDVISLEVADDTDHGVHHHHDQGRSGAAPPVETVEAAMNRFTKAYHIAMECIGALYRCDHTAMVAADAATSTTTTPATTPATTDTTTDQTTTTTDSTATIADDTTTIADDTTTTTVAAVEATLIRVGYAARRTMEDSILSDIRFVQSQSYAPAWWNEQQQQQHMQQQQYNLGDDNENRVKKKRRRVELTASQPPQRTTSTSTLSNHRTNVVRQITYLTLVNYADLLLAGLPSTSSSNRQPGNISILDRGVVKKLQYFNNTSPPLVDGGGSCSDIINKGEGNMSKMRWLPSTVGPGGGSSSSMHCSTATTATTTRKRPLDNDDDNNHNNSYDTESPETTIRFAIAAYLDAVALDPTDPTVWIKLACAVRRLQRILQQEQNESSSMTTAQPPPITNHHYRRLERYALERAVTALPVHEPPNRLAVRALEEWYVEQKEDSEQQQHENKFPEIESLPLPSTPIIVDVPRYSWSTLGRMLLRMGQDGNWLYHHNASSTTFKAGRAAHHRALIHRGGGPSSSTTNTPMISVRLSPMLILPTRIVANVVSYLDTPHKWRLEVTCRAMSALVLSARAVLDNVSERQRRQTPMVEHHSHDNSNDAMNRGTGTLNAPEGASRGVPDHGLSNLDRPEGDAVMENEDDGAEEVSKRVSKRVRTQMLTSGKRTERSNRRNSVEYCLLAATLGCTVHDPNYVQLIQQQQPSSSSSSFLLGGSGQQLERSATHDERWSSRSDKEITTERLSDASLPWFIQSCTLRGTGSSLGHIFRMVAHVSLHIAQVYSSDVSGSSVLSSCLLDCLEWMTNRTIADRELVSSWSISEHTVPKDAKLTRIDLFAIDLLHAELRLRRCEGEDGVSFSFDSDGYFVCTMMPYLVRVVDEIETDAGEVVPPSWNNLKVRCYWFVTNVYFWRGRLSSDAVESRQAEKEGIEWISKTRQCLSSIGTVSTPHLSSPNRKEPLWKALTVDSLLNYLDEIQAASIVHLAREQFLKATSKYTKGDTELPLEKDDFDTLVSVGALLFARYSVDSSSPDAKYSELIDDFISVHGDRLLVPSSLDPASEQANRENTQRWFNGLYPSTAVEIGVPLFQVTDPCILTILVLCLKTKEEHHPNILLLLVRLVSTLVDLSGLHAGRLRHKHINATQPETSDGDVDDEDDDLSSEDGMTSSDELKRSKDSDSLKFAQYAAMIPPLLSILCTYCTNTVSEMDKSCFAQSNEFTNMLTSTMAFVADWFDMSRNVKSDTYSAGDVVAIFQATKALFRSAVPISATHETWMTKLATLYISGLFQIVISQRRVLSVLLRAKPTMRDRSERVRTTRKQAELIATTCCDVGLLLSQFLVVVEDGQMRRSLLFDGSRTEVLPTFELAQFCDSLLWLWKAATSVGKDVGSQPNPADEFAHVSSYLDSFGRDRLRVPVATAIIGLCGSGTSTDCVVGATTSTKAQIDLSEFCDSDDSAFDWKSDEDDDELLDGGRKVNEDLLRVTVQAIHCVSCVFDKIDEKEACIFPHVQDYISEWGPCLPLVTVRVLNHLSFHLLVSVRKNKEPATNPLWSDYPAGTQTVGMLADSVLHKAYKYLHGFVLTRDTKESTIATGGSGSSKLTHQFAPESKEAAAMLYRCITRAYSNGRRSPPKAALDTVLAALPVVKGSASSKAIRDYIFSSSTSGSPIADLASAATNKCDWGEHLSLLDGFKFDNEDSTRVPEDESYLVRRGLARLIAQGPLPRIQDGGDEGDWRSSAAQAEEHLSSKFSAVIDNLCYGNICDCEGWFKASECLTMKAELIADRLGLMTGFTRNPRFYPSEHGCLRKAVLTLANLEALQTHEAHRREQSWRASLGEDLSVFVRYSWSSFTALKQCSAEIGSVYSASLAREGDDGDDGEDTKFAFNAHVWQEINSLYLKRDFDRWQHAWGGLFVSSLRMAAYRCLTFAMYILYNRIDPATNKSTLLGSEVSEALGTNLYTELMGSQAYGYPMREMSVYRKRQLAEASLACFERSVELAESDDQASNGRITWDLTFMIGKCHEKIAKSYEREEFPTMESDTSSMRKYEEHVQLALQAYSRSVEQAKEAESNGSIISEQNGGSAHGAVEAVYRLHASRLKCLISAADHHEDDRELAELEALRLTECHWHTVPDASIPQGTVRDRVGRVLIDVVDALAKCSLDYSYFHRSVYRHAQALLWTPILCDPIKGRVRGDVETVPASWACKIRGLNASTSVSSSGLTIISSLFTKKRPQLVAVWVTGDRSTSAFQAINNTVRKYDSLRGKYIAGYVDCLRLCRRRKELDTFLSWTTSTPSRDLPSYFAATTLTQGRKTRQSHAKESLVVANRSVTAYHFLTSVRRMANSALANVIVQDLHDPAFDEIHSKPAERAKFCETQLKLAYVCFLRLNCTVNDIIQGRSWKYPRNSGVKDVMEALTAAFGMVVQKDHDLPSPLALGGDGGADWSGESQMAALFQTAVRKCRVLYPNLSSNFSFSKQQPRGRSTTVKGADIVVSPSLSATAGGHNKRRRSNSISTQPPSSTVDNSDEVNVPEGELPEAEPQQVRTIASDEVKVPEGELPEAEPQRVQTSDEVNVPEGGLPEVETCQASVQGTGSDKKLPLSAPPGDEDEDHAVASLQSPVPTTTEKHDVVPTSNELELRE